ncbi:hypothetical protein CEK25_009110 [Fusarium fujikuroi]|nr:hypothetical protein CEK25_009110 [Fusarium fujikuroi]
MSSPASHRDESTDLSPTVTNTSMDSEPKKAGKRVLSSQNSLHSKFASSAKEAQASESRSSRKACEMRRTS